MKIKRTWMIERVRETQWPRGQKAPALPKATALTPVVAVVGIKGDNGSDAMHDPGDVLAWFNIQLQL